MENFITNIFILIWAAIIVGLFYIDKKYPWDYPIERRALLIFFGIYVFAIKLPSNALNWLSEKIIDKIDSIWPFSITLWKWSKKKE